MARSSKAEPIEKFRFTVNFYSVDRNLFNNSLEASSSIQGGFSEVVLPKANVNTIEYRENIDMNRTTKQPGLISYEPIVLRRGVTNSRDLYNWYKKVHNDVYNLNTANEILSSANIVPIHESDFRKELIITSLDREGKAIKHWLCFNCFPISYKGGNDLNASSEEKLIEELVITYEAFVEVTGDTIDSALQNVTSEAEKAVLNAILAAYTGAVAGAIGASILG